MKSYSFSYETFDTTIMNTILFFLFARALDFAFNKAHDLEVFIIEVC